MEISGKIKIIKETQTFGDKGFKKRELVVTTDEQYPQQLLLEFIQDNCELLNNFTINDEVKIAINIRGKEWISPEGKTKYFNTLQGWKIDYEGEVSKSTPNKQSEIDDKDDLPF